MSGQVILSYGAGTNSKAILCEIIRRSERLDAIVFADTGGERPDTYANLLSTSKFSESCGYPAITIVRRTALVGDVTVSTLEEECLMRKQLPGIAYGFKSCSDKWKQQPFKKWLKSTGWEDVTVLIGFDADEPHRAARGDTYESGYVKRYPLIEWSMGREECIASISAAGQSLPGKSACFYCPSSKVAEILALPDDLKKRAVAMEKNADLTTIAGLGRRFSWGDLIKSDNAQEGFDFQRLETPCGCYDGDDVANHPASTDKSIEGVEPQ